MQIGHSSCDLRDIVSHSQLIEGGVFDQSIVKIAFSYFHDQIDPIFADVVTVSRKDVRVVAKHVNFHLVNQKLQF